MVKKNKKKLCKTVLFKKKKILFVHFLLMNFLAREGDDDNKTSAMFDFIMQEVLRSRNDCIIILDIWENSGS